MNIFVPKHALVEAYQFNGGEDNAADIIQALDIHGVRALHAGWSEEPEDADPKKERLLIETSKFEYEPAHIGSWVVIHQDNRVDIVTHPVMRDRYSKMGLDGGRF